MSIQLNKDNNCCRSRSYINPVMLQNYLLGENNSRWQSSQEFIFSKRRAYLEVLSTIVNESNLLPHAHQALLEVSKDERNGSC